jgi:hypothetical protein
MRVLALDIATVSGWAFGEPGTAPTFGHWRLAQPSEPRAHAHRAFRAWLETWMAKGPDQIVYESPLQPMMAAGKTNIGTTRLLIGLCEHLEEWAHGRVELSEVPVWQVRAHFIGRNFKSATAKALTMERCHDLGWQTQTPDEADACALWDYKCCLLRPDLAERTAPLFA